MILQVGNRVRFMLGPREVTGTVVEDRGFIGAEGRQLVRVEVKIEPNYEAVFEVPADEVQAA